MLKACACAGEQGSRGAGEQGSRGEFNVPSSIPSAPLPLCPSAFQTCEKCGKIFLSSASNQVLWVVKTK
ncbi:MAG: hypothetical protein V7L23_07460 [Nostoc sp.]|uniref:hypothetical protein n=1 Tax=Nostoc sp. TaxID=1180 RepID=UPI002FEF7AE8